MKVNPRHNQVKALKDAAQKKKEETVKRVHLALHTMEQESIPINFESVASFSKVSKSWLYRNPPLRKFINERKDTVNKNFYMQEQAKRLASKDKEIEKLKSQNRLLKKQNCELKAQLEVAYATLYEQED